MLDYLNSATGFTQIFGNLFVAAAVGILLAVVVAIWFERRSRRPPGRIRNR